jgi:hypothetical protein
MLETFTCEGAVECAYDDRHKAVVAGDACGMFISYDSKAF